jgi:DNA-binding NarL/FixJ family response regulator
MLSKRRLLLVEDIPMQYDSLKTQLEANEWQLVHATDEQSAMRQIAQAQEEKWPVEIAVVDLGLPPGVDNPFRGGLPLIKQLRTWQDNLPILAYTSILPTAVDYSILVAEFLPRRVSFVYLRQLVGPPSFTEAVELVWKGFFLLSPAAADQLPMAVADRPDPLPDEMWQTLELLSNNLGQKEVAFRLGTVKKDAVKSRIARIKDMLEDRGELERYQADTPGIVDWYRTHYVRYRRFPQKVM